MKKKRTEAQKKLLRTMWQQDNEELDRLYYEKMGITETVPGPRRIPAVEGLWEHEMDLMKMRLGPSAAELGMLVLDIPPASEAERRAVALRERLTNQIVRQNIDIRSDHPLAVAWKQATDCIILAREIARLSR